MTLWLDLKQDALNQKGKTVQKYFRPLKVSSETFL